MCAICYGFSSCWYTHQTLYLTGWKNKYFWAQLYPSVWNVPASTGQTSLLANRYDTKTPSTKPTKMTQRLMSWLFPALEECLTQVLIMNSRVWAFSGNGTKKNRKIHTFAITTPESKTSPDAKIGIRNWKQSNAKVIKTRSHSFPMLIINEPQSFFTYSNLIMTVIDELVNVK